MVTLPDSILSEGTAGPRLHLSVRTVSRRWASKITASGVRMINIIGEILGY